MFCGRSLVLLIGSVLLFCETNPIVRKSVFPRNFRQSVGQELDCTNCLNKILFHCTHSFSSLCKSSHLRCSIKKLFLKFRNIHRKTPGLKFLFNKGAGLQAYNFIEKKVQHRCFPVNKKFLRTLILKNIGERLLLVMYMLKIVTHFYMKL